MCFHLLQKKNMIKALIFFLLVYIFSCDVTTFLRLLIGQNDVTAFQRLLIGQNSETYFWFHRVTKFCSDKEDAAHSYLKSVFKTICCILVFFLSVVQFDNL